MLVGLVSGHSCCSEERGFATTLLSTCHSLDSFSRLAEYGVCIYADDRFAYSVAVGRRAVLICLWQDGGGTYSLSFPRFVNKSRRNS